MLELKESATVLEMSSTSMTSGRRSRLLVSSRMMTHTDTVIRSVPPRKEAEPRMATRPWSRPEWPPSSMATRRPGGAGEDDGYEQPRRRDDAVAEHAERVGGDEEGEHGARVVDVVGARGVEVADGIVVDVEEEAGQVVVVPRRAVEPPEPIQRVAAPIRRRRRRRPVGRARPARRQPRHPEHDVRMDIAAASSSLCALPLLHNTTQQI
uniref:Uncharacterized protein n=1 Tax=Oryza brachyantha TaxID=4533 RepID=J3MRZ5_ORYBR